MPYTMTKRIEWDMAHRVPEHESKCCNLHGHRYAAEITCQADDLTREGFVLDFGSVKHIVGRWIDANWDHTTMYQASDKYMRSLREAHDMVIWRGGISEDLGNRLKAWYEVPFAPTVEHIARALFDKATELLGGARVRVVKVRVYETPTAWAEWPG